MSLAPPHTCSCGRIVVGRCAVCRAKWERSRPHATARGYDARWALFSRSWLARHPWCGERADGHLYSEHSACVAIGSRVRATITDHIRPLAAGGAHCSELNSQSLCARCNTRKGRAWPQTT